MADDGNLDALCWSAECAPVPPERSTLHEMNRFEKAPVDSLGNLDLHRRERRQSKRRRARDLVGFGETLRGDHPSGWLVDTSREGIAFIAETRDAPAVGSRILSRIDHRDGEAVEFG